MNPRFANGGGRGRGRGRRGGRPGGRQDNQRGRGNPANGPVKQICNFYARGSCTNGDTCRFSHAITAVSNLPTNSGPIKSVAVTQDGWIFVAADKTILMYNSSSGSMQLADSFTLEVENINHIEVFGQFLIVSVDCFIDQYPQVTVGLVNILNLSSGQTISAVVSYLHLNPHNNPLSCRTRDLRLCHIRIHKLSGNLLLSRWAMIFIFSRLDLKE